MDVLNKLNNKRNIYNLQFAEKEAVLTKMNGKMDKLRADLEIYYSEVNRIEEDYEIDKALQFVENRISKLTKQIQELKDFTTLSHQEMESTFRFAFRKKNELRRRLELKEQQLKQTETQLIGARNKAEVLKEKKKTKELEKDQTRLKMAQKNKTELETDISLIEEAISELRRSIGLIEQDIKNETVRVNQVLASGVECKDTETPGADNLIVCKSLPEGTNTSEDIELRTDLEKKSPINEIALDEDVEIAKQTEEKGILPMKEDYVASETTYYMIYGVEPREYSDIDIQSLHFSKRLENRLLKEGYLTVENLLKTNDDTLGEIHGFGKTCFDELHKYLQTLQESSFQDKGKQIDSVITNELVPFKEQILREDFGFLSEFEFNETFLRTNWKSKVLTINIICKGYCVTYMKMNGFLEEIIYLRMSHTHRYILVLLDLSESLSIQSQKKT